MECILPCKLAKYITNFNSCHHCLCHIVFAESHQETHSPAIAIFGQKLSTKQKGVHGHILLFLFSVCLGLNGGSFQYAQSNKLEIIMFIYISQNVKMLTYFYLHCLHYMFICAGLSSVKFYYSFYEKSSMLSS